MSAALHLASGHTSGTRRAPFVGSVAAVPSGADTTNDPQTRVTLMRRRPIGRSRHTSLHGLFSTGQTLTIFWTALPLPSVPFGLDVRTYHLDTADVRACLDADVWGHEILGYVPVLVDATSVVLPAQHRLSAEHFARPENLLDLLTNLCAQGSGIPELADPARAPVTPSGRVLLTRWVAIPELGDVVEWDTALRIQDSERVVYSTPAAHLQKMVLQNMPLGVRASSIAKDLDDTDDVLMAASRMYSPTSGSPYRWFQVAMNDARRLGVKLR